MRIKFVSPDALQRMRVLLSAALQILDCQAKADGWEPSQYSTLMDALSKSYELSKGHDLVALRSFTEKTLETFQKLGPTLREGESIDFSKLNAADLTAPYRDLVAASQHLRSLMILHGDFQVGDHGLKLSEMRLLKRFARFCGKENRARVECIYGNLEKDVREMRGDSEETPKSIRRLVRWHVYRTILSVTWDGFCRFVAVLVPIAKIINKWRGL